MLNDAKWRADRQKDETLAGIARRMLASGKKFPDMKRRVQQEMRIRQLFILEALIANGGSLTQTSRCIGVTRKTIYEALRSLGITVDRVRELAKAVQEGR